MKLSKRTEFDEDEMPSLCVKCKGWFDLNDGRTSLELRNTIICDDCYQEERQEQDEEE